MSCGSALWSLTTESATVLETLLQLQTSTKCHNASEKFAGLLLFDAEAEVDTEAQWDSEQNDRTTPARRCTCTLIPT